MLAPHHPGTTTVLQLEEANALASAWVSALSWQHGIRLLVIKGLSLTHHQLRPPRASADVDVLVDPAQYDVYCAHLENSGWRLRALSDVGKVWAPHSRTYYREGWPCDLDVHRFFPGFFAEPATVFGVLWADRTSIPIAHISCSIPSREASILIAGLHHLRDGPARVDNAELASLMQLKLDSRSRERLIEVARSTQAVDGAWPLLEALGFTADGVGEVPSGSAAARIWRARIEAESNGGFFWLLLLEQTPPLHRPIVLLRAIWPSRGDLRLNYPGMQDTFGGRLRKRLARLVSAPRAFPTALGALRRRWR